MRGKISLYRLFICLLLVLLILYIGYYIGRPNPVGEAVEKGYRFLSGFLWDDEKGAYRECPPPNPEGRDKLYWGDDNHLAYIFHTEYPSFKDGVKARRILEFLKEDPPRLGDGRRRWIVLSGNYSEFTSYGDRSYADRIDLDGIFYARTGDTGTARRLFGILISEMYDPASGLIEDKATGENGYEYYKLGLTLILASYLREEFYVERLVDKPLSLQGSDGSWLTDDKDLETTYPNTETMIIILMALDHARKSYPKSIGYPVVLVPPTSRIGLKPASRKPGKKVKVSNLFVDRYAKQAFHRDPQGYPSCREARLHL